MGLSVTNNRREDRNNTGTLSLTLVQ